MLAVAMVYRGDVEGGMALAEQVAEEATQAGLPWLATRAFIALSDTQLMLGRYDEAVQTAERGIALAEQAGFGRTMGAFMRSNKAEALMRSGRWDAALASAAPGAEAPGVFAGYPAAACAPSSMRLSGRPDEAAADLREARRHLRNSTAAQFTLPLAGVEAELARASGDLTAARQIIADALGREDLGDEPRYKWPLMSSGARVEAEPAVAARDAGEPASDAEQRIAELREAAERTAATTPADFGHLALVRAEHARVRREQEIEAWSAAVAACRAMNEPLPLAYALLRHAETLTGDGQTEAAATSADEALELAQMMGAVPMLDDIQALIRRARLSVNGRRGARGGHGARAGRARAVRVDRAGGRSAPPGRRRAVQHADRRAVVHLPQDGQRPRLQHPRQAGSVHARAGGRRGAPARPGPGAGRRLSRVPRTRSSPGH